MRVSGVLPGRFGGPIGVESAPGGLGKSGIIYSSVWVCRFPFCGFVLERFASGVGSSSWAVSGEAALCGGGVVLSIPRVHRS